MSSFDLFVKHLRYALNHLYEPEVLQYSPLNKLLVVEEDQKPVKSLDRILIEAINSIKPGLTTPPDSQIWRTYEFLYYRYVQCALQSDLSKQFSCSIRQIGREQSKALAVLANHLLQQAGIYQANLPDLKVISESNKITGDDDSIKMEYEWLIKNSRRENIDVSTELIALRDVLRPLLEEYKVHLELNTSPSYLITTMPDAALRQIFLSLLTNLIHIAANNNIRIHGRQDDQYLHILVETSDLLETDIINSNFEESLHDVKNLLLLGHGSLLSKQKRGNLSIDICLPSVKSVPILVIDDNRDLLQLFERYTYGTRYWLLPCENPGKVMELIDANHPAAITLDLMMNSIDGWQLLREFRRNPISAHIPIIVCSVLKQDELARSLGASDFIHKPVSQEMFLSALNRHVPK